MSPKTFCRIFNIIYGELSLNGHVAFGDITIYESQLLRNCRPGLS